MAVLAITSRTERAPMGSHWLQSFRVSCSTGTPTDEYVPTGLNKIISVVGCAVIGAAGGLSTVAFVKNARGSAGTEDTYGGDLGIEADDARVVEVTVLGD